MKKIITNKKVIFLFLSLLVGQLFYKIFDFNWYLIALVLIMFFLFIKLPKKINFVFLIILFFLVLSLNKLFTLSFNPFQYSFDWEKIVWTNPGYLKLIDNYRNENLWLPFKLRVLFYSPWLLTFSWLDLFFKLITPVFLIRMLGFSGFILIFFGIINFFKKSKKNWRPLVWFLVVISSSACGMLTDSKNSLILALPSIIYFMYLGLTDKTFEKYQKYWYFLLLIDLILK